VPVSEESGKVLTRQWRRPEGWRDTKAGMWAWLIQRGAALALLVVVVLHLRNPFVRPVQALLLALVLVHGLLGVRALLLDGGLPVRWQRALFAGALALAAALFALVWTWRWY
jgi:succinate dehydrogenase hydrophobic anchor subunit